MVDVNPNNRITVVEYKKYVGQINTLAKAVYALLESDDRELVSAGQELTPTLRRMSDSLARLLALTAQAYTALNKGKDYHIDAIYTALGRYNYSEAPYGSDADALTRLTYELEKLEQAVAQAEAPLTPVGDDDLPPLPELETTAYEQETAPA